MLLEILYYAQASYELVGCVSWYRSVIYYEGDYVFVIAANAFLFMHLTG